mmetsp:Transcript_778/g.1268  ORF Transcript_778/g.1268 Transcript_778/m.1268 type:complete len:119 (+) Transcript_778:212-568(+)
MLGLVPPVVAAPGVAASVDVVPAAVALADVAAAPVVVAPVHVAPVAAMHGQPVLLGRMVWWSGISITAIMMMWVVRRVASVAIVGMVVLWHLPLPQENYFSDHPTPLFYISITLPSPI